MEEPETLTAAAFVAALEERRSDEELARRRRYLRPEQLEGGTVLLGVRMGEVFALAKRFVDLPLDEVERLLEHDANEVRSGALRILDERAKRRRTTPEERDALAELYLRRHDRIDSWDLVDLAAPRVIGGWLMDRPRDPLDELAASEVVWERRTAIVATLHLVRQGELDDTYRIAELLVGDDQDLVHTAVGGVLREAGKRDQARLEGFLDAHAASMPATMLRYATERLEPELRDRYRRARRSSSG